MRRSISLVWTLPIAAVVSATVLHGTADAAIPPAIGPATQERPAWLTADAQAAIESIQVDHVRETVFFLASDALEGRNTPSPGLAIAAAFIESRFKAAGLEIHRSPLVMSTEAPGSASVQGTLLGAEGPMELAADDAVCVAGSRTAALKIDNRPSVYFASVEDMATEQRSEDRGKILIIDAAAPGSNDDPRLSSFRWLSFTSMRAGIAAVVLIVEEGAGGDRRFATARKNALASTARSRGGASTPIVMIRGPVATALRDAGSALETGATLPKTMSLEIGPVKPTEAVTHSICAMLPGSDPLLKEQTILVSAHYDHIGISQPQPDGDALNNGADDNASGTTAVLELAAAFARLPVAPRRSLLFVCFTGEEKGLLGSRAYAENPVVPIRQTVANINIEMIGRPDDIEPNQAWVTGYKFSDVGSLMAAAATAVGFEFYEHPQLSAQLFGASDNAPLAAKGIPAHSFSAGSLHDQYHRPGDEVELLDLPNMTSVIQALFAGTLHLAQRDEAPVWAEIPATKRYRDARQ